MELTEETRAEARGLADALSAHLSRTRNEQWAVVGEDRGSYWRFAVNLRGPGGAVVEICTDDYRLRGKWCCKGDLSGLFDHRPFGAGGDYTENPEACVSMGRPADRVVKDFARRVIPGFLELRAGCLIRKAAREAERTETRAALQQVADAFGTTIRDQDRTDGGGSVYFADLPTISTAHNGELRIEDFRTTPEKAIRILKILQEK